MLENLKGLDWPSYYLYTEIRLKSGFNENSKSLNDFCIKYDCSIEQSQEGPILDPQSQFENWDIKDFQAIKDSLKINSTIIIGEELSGKESLFGWRWDGQNFISLSDKEMKEELRKEGFRR